MHAVQQFLQTLSQRLAPAWQWLRVQIDVIWQWLRVETDSILASPHRWIVYVVAVGIAVLLITIPLLRGSRRRRRRRSESFEEIRSYSVLGIGSAPLAGGDDIHRPQYPRWADVTPLPQQAVVPPPISQQVVSPPTSQPAVPPPTSQPVSPPISNVTPLHPSMSVTCTHCGATLSAHQDFCPACGFAQPAQQTVTA